MNGRHPRLGDTSEKSAARALALREAGAHKRHVRISADTYARLEAHCMAHGIDVIGRLVDEIIEKTVPEVATSRERLRRAAAEAEDLIGDRRRS